MKQIMYAMHLRGQASQSAADRSSLKLTTSGTSSRMDTLVGPAGVETSLHPSAGDLAFCESEVHRAGGDAFDGSGTLTFGDEGIHEIRFATVHPGHLGPSGLAGVMAGSVTWHVKGGSGRYEAATGLITSTFTLTDSGDLSEYQCALIFVAE